MASDLTWIGFISAACGFGSVLAATWMLLTSLRFSRKASKFPVSNLYRTIFLINIIKWLSLCDVILGIINGTQFLSVASSKFDIINTDYDTWLCVSKAFVLQFCQVGGVCWNFILGIILLQIVVANDSDQQLDKVSSQMKYYHTFVWLTASISCIIPLRGGAFGYVNNQNGKDFECWIKIGIFQLCLYGPIGVVLIFSIGLLSYCIYLLYSCIYYCIYSSIY